MKVFDMLKIHGNIKRPTVFSNSILWLLPNEYYVFLLSIIGKDSN